MPDYRRPNVDTALETKYLVGYLLQLNCRLLQLGGLQVPSLVTFLGSVRSMW